MSEKYTMTMINGDAIEITQQELEDFDRKKNKADFSFPSGIRIFRAHVVGIYPEGAEPIDVVLHSQGRKRSTKKRIGGAKSKKTMVDRYGKDGADKIVGKGRPIDQRGIASIEDEAA